MSVNSLQSSYKCDLKYSVYSTKKTMADNPKIRSYRIVWRINFGLIHLEEYKTTSFIISNEDWCVKMTRVCDGPESCGNKFRFNLCKPGITQILRGFFYLLSERHSECTKLDNFSPFESIKTELIRRDGDLTLVCAFDIECSDRTLASSSEHWLETKTEIPTKITTDDGIHIVPMFKPIFVDGNTQLYSISLSELKRKCVQLQISHRDDVLKHRIVAGLDKGKRLAVQYHDLQGQPVELCVGHTETEHDCYFYGIRISVSAILYEFREMSQDRIYKIDKIIRKSCSDTLMKKNRIDSSSLQAVRNVKEKRTKTVITPILIRNENEKDSAALQTTTDTPSCSKVSLPEATTANMTDFPYIKFCDITIQVPGGSNFRAHKFILSGKSSVWRQLLSNNVQLSIITIEDLEEDIIEALVNFIYIGSVPEPPKCIDQLLIAADKYGVDDLKKWCEQQLINTITVPSAVNLLILANRYIASDLYERVINFVRQHIAELKEREEFNSLFFTYPDLALKLFNNII